MKNAKRESLSSTPIRWQDIDLQIRTALRLGGTPAINVGGFTGAVRARISRHQAVRQ